MPQDPASGAARSDRTVAEWLSKAGFAVAALGTTATEQGQPEPAPLYLSKLGCKPRVDARGAVGGRLPLIRFEHRGVAYTLMNTGAESIKGWQEAHSPQFDKLLERMIDEHKPEVVLTYGGTRFDVARRALVRSRGCALVFALHNLGYLAPRSLDHVDAITAPSHFLAERYFTAAGVTATPLPMPIDPADVIAPESAREPKYVTFMNPTPSKGVMFFARLAEELASRRPDIPLLVVDSRGSGEQLAGAALAGGFDLRQHGSIMHTRQVPVPASIYAVSRVVLCPSVVEEAAGRVAAESLMNGIPLVVSDRGGLPEIAGDGGFVLPLPRELTVATSRPVEASAVRDWGELIERLHDDAGFYAESSARALRAGGRFMPEVTAPQWMAFFEAVTRKP